MPWSNFLKNITISTCFLWSRSRFHDWNVAFVNDPIALYPARGEGSLSTKTMFAVCRRAEEWRSSQKACMSLGKPRRKASFVGHSHTQTTSFPSSTHSPHHLVGDRDSVDTEGQRHPEGICPMSIKAEGLIVWTYLTKAVDWAFYKRCYTVSVVNFN